MPSRDADRNLLFGINALHNDFIGRDELIAAMNAWVLAKDRPIGEILVERGALTPLDRDVLEAMVARRLARYDDDPATSLASLGSAGAIAEDLRRGVATDPDLTASLGHVPTEARRDTLATRPPDTVDHRPAGEGRFRKVRDHARGGLGIVYVALDGELRREVALKEIKPEYADNPASQGRFLLEAEITGGLEHPGIVPVYSLGHHDDGRPFYAMRLIKGDSLKHAIADFHEDPTLKSDPGVRTLALQKLLRRFLDVCNAIAYAHSRGILHRDLKPDNVMVGRYGETLVVDWGLAKATGRSDSDGPGPSPGSGLLRPGPNGPDETQQGSVLGTPAYMSPEQAAGRVDLLGPASDVYSLGATLYTLLTGRVPVVGEDLHDLLRKVERGEFPRPREHSPWLDPALEAICLKAMATRPESRHAGARDLADDLDRWIAGEPVAAYPEPWTRRARRWSRKHRTAAATAATALAALAVLFGSIARLRADQRRRDEATIRESLASAQSLAAGARATGDLARWDAAIREVERIGRQLEAAGGGPDLRREVQMGLTVLRSEREDRRTVVALDEARLLAANVKDGAFDTGAKLDAYRDAFRGHGLDVATLPVEEFARRVRASPIAADLIAALDDWASHRQHNVPTPRLGAIARAAEADPTRVAIRDAAARRDAAAIRRLCGSADDRRKLGPGLRSAFDALLRIDPAGNFPLLETIRREHPSDFWLNNNLGNAYRQASPPKHEDAVRCLSIAVALRPESPGAFVNLGVALHAQGKLDEAEAAFRESVRLKPDYALAHSDLGLVLQAQGKADDAIAAYREAIRLKPDYAAAHANLGLALVDRGRLDEAIAEHREAIRLRPDLALAHISLGVSLNTRGRVDEAVAEHREAIRLEPESALAHLNLGIALKARGEVDAAVAAFREAIRLKPNLAPAHYSLGVALQGQGNADGAIAEFREAARLDGDRIGHAIWGLGDALRARRRFDEAIATFRRARDLARGPDQEAHASNGIGDVLWDQGRADEAIAAYREAIRIKPDDAAGRYTFGLKLVARGLIDQGIDEVREAARLDGDRPGLAIGKLGDLLQDAGRSPEAIAAYREAIRIKPDDAVAHLGLGSALKSMGDSRGSSESFRRARELLAGRPDPGDRPGRSAPEARRPVELEGKLAAILKGEARSDDPSESLGLAGVCSETRRHATAVRFWAEAFAGQPALAVDLARAHRFNAACSAALAGTGQSRDDPMPDADARAGLRERARGWLRADLAAWAGHLDGGDEPARKPAVAKALTHWKEDPDLAGIRDPAAIEKLPESEREGFRTLWADVDALLARANGGVGP